MAAKKTVDDLDEIDKAILRDLLTRELVQLENSVGRGFTSDNNETMIRLRSLYSRFMRESVEATRTSKEKAK